MTGLHSFSLAYGGLVDSATPLLPSGQQGAPVTAGWNEVTNAADNNLTTSISGAPVSLPAVNPANGVVAAPTGAADVVYARFLDSNGNVVAGGWIKVDAASLGLTNSLTGPNSRATFTPLSLTLNPGSLASTLFGDEPALAKFSQIDVAVYAPGAQGALIDDYRFKTAVVSGIDDTINQAGTQTYNFKYGDLQSAYFALGSNGAPTAVSGWNNLTNTSDTVFSPLNPAPATAAAAAGGAPVGAATNLDYYLSFTDSNGNVLSLRRQQSLRGDRHRFRLARDGRLEQSRGRRIVIQAAHLHAGLVGDRRDPRQVSHLGRDASTDQPLRLQVRADDAPPGAARRVQAGGARFGQGRRQRPADVQRPVFRVG